jgi:hypothetical protein
VRSRFDVGAIPIHVGAIVASRVGIGAPKAKWDRTDSEE